MYVYKLAFPSGHGTVATLAHVTHVAKTELLGVGGGGGDDNVPRTCTHVRCYAADGVGLRGKRRRLGAVCEYVAS